MGVVASHAVKTFTVPVNKTTGVVDANEVRGNDNALRTAYNAHDADSGIHHQSGLYSARPATANTGALYTATDKDATYFWTGSAWDQIWSGRRYGAFQDTTTQSVASANTATLMTLNTVDIPDGVTLVGGSKVTALYSGVYNLQWSGQFVNADTQIQDVDVWVKINGVDLTGSNGRISVPNKHGGVNGALLPGWNYYLSLNANDYVQLYWASTSTLVTLAALSASSPHPATASLIVTMGKV